MPLCISDDSANLKQLFSLIMENKFNEEERVFILYESDSKKKMDFHN